MTSPDMFGMVTGSTRIFFLQATLLFPVIFLIVSSKRYLHLSPPSLIQVMSCDQVSFWNCNCMKLCNRKFPSAVQLK